MLDIQKAPLKELLGFAIRSEIDSHDVYSDLAQKYSNPLLKEKFEWLAFEEGKHRITLEKLFDALLPDEKLEIPDKPSKELFKRIVITPTSTLVDLLYQAMESEKRAEEFYGRLADRIGPPHHKILEYLSQVEHSHYTMLSGEYVLAQGFEDYGEKDIDKVVT
ncbi:MAG: ferritin family protein [Candidatus Aminicenantales bacterium]